jgi:hypothetical protein
MRKCLVAVLVVAGSNFNIGKSKQNCLMKK